MPVIDIKQGMGWTDLTTRSHPNFCDANGNAYMVKCPKCKKENYALNVAYGVCTWCEFDLNEYINHSHKNQPMPKDKTTTTETPAGTTTVEERPQTETTTVTEKPAETGGKAD